ncbi:MAG: dephospho-CoA kinase [Planctomycetota bacterium]|jgi:dephospho-CoA kinase
MRNRPFIVGILGGVASGKTTVATQFAALGARVVDADAEAHEVLRDPSVRARLVEAYGEGILGPGGEIEHGRLADAAFGPPRNTERLNRIVHPEVVRRLRAAAGERGGVVVFDAALLLEGGLFDACDLVVFVEAGEALREARAKGRGWEEGEVKRREESQVDLSEKRLRARVVIDNGGSLEETKEQVRRIYTEIILPGLGKDDSDSKDASVSYPSS